MSFQDQICEFLNASELTLVQRLLKEGQDRWDQPIPVAKLQGNWGPRMYRRTLGLLVAAGIVVSCERCKDARGEPAVKVTLITPEGYAQLGSKLRERRERRQKPGPKPGFSRSSPESAEDYGYDLPEDLAAEIASGCWAQEPEESQETAATPEAPAADQDSKTNENTMIDPGQDDSTFFGYSNEADQPQADDGLGLDERLLGTGTVEPPDFFELDVESSPRPLADLAAEQGVALPAQPPEAPVDLDAVREVAAVGIALVRNAILASNPEAGEEVLAAKTPSVNQAVASVAPLLAMAKGNRDVVEAYLARMVPKKVDDAGVYSPLGAACRDTDAEGRIQSLLAQHEIGLQKRRHAQAAGQIAAQAIAPVDPALAADIEALLPLVASCKGLEPHVAKTYLHKLRSWGSQVAVEQYLREYLPIYVKKAEAGVIHTAPLAVCCLEKNAKGVLRATDQKRKVREAARLQQATMAPPSCSEIIAIDLPAGSMFLPAHALPRTSALGEYRGWTYRYNGTVSRWERKGQVVTVMAPNPTTADRPMPVPLHRAVALGQVSPEAAARSTPPSPAVPGSLHALVASVLGSVAPPSARPVPASLPAPAVTRPAVTRPEAGSQDDLLRRREEQKARFAAWAAKDAAASAKLGTLSGVMALENPTSFVAGSPGEVRESSFPPSSPPPPLPVEVQPPGELSFCALDDVWSCQLVDECPAVPPVAWAALPCPSSPYRWWTVEDPSPSRWAETGPGKPADEADVSTDPLAWLALTSVGFLRSALVRSCLGAVASVALPAGDRGWQQRVCLPGWHSATAYRSLDWPCRYLSSRVATRCRGKRSMLACVAIRRPGVPSSPEAPR